MASMIKAWLILCIGFLYATLALYICLMYVSNNVGSDSYGWLKKDQIEHANLHVGQGTSDVNDSNKAFGNEPAVEQRRAVGVNVNLSRNKSTDSSRKVDKPQLPWESQDTILKTRNQTRENQNLQRNSSNNSRMVLNSEELSAISGLKTHSLTTPDPLYIHREYVGVLNNKKKLNLHCKRCALVSSSGQLLNSRMGREIDEADCVFRTNDAPVLTYEDDVGTRTTVRVVSHVASSNLRSKHLTLIRDNPTKYIVGWGPLRALRRQGFAFKNHELLARIYKKVGFFHITQEQMNKADAIFEAETGHSRVGSRTHLSTGWFTMILARSSCGEIHVYGMINDTYCQTTTARTVPYHYYQPSTGLKECSYYQSSEKRANSHRFITEKSIFARWALQQPPIFFHAPNWNP